MPEEVDDVSNQLLTILKVVYQAKLIMEESNKLVRKEIADVKKSRTSERPVVFTLFQY